MRRHVASHRPAVPHRPPERTDDPARARSAGCAARAPTRRRGLSHARADRIAGGRRSGRRAPSPGARARRDWTASPPRCARGLASTGHRRPPRCGARSATTRPSSPPSVGCSRTDRAICATRIVSAIADCVRMLDERRPDDPRSVRRASAPQQTLRLRSRGNRSILGACSTRARSGATGGRRRDGWRSKTIRSPGWGCMRACPPVRGWPVLARRVTAVIGGSTLSAFNRPSPGGADAMRQVCGHEMSGVRSFRGGMGWGPVGRR
jgi:hypothetical protein